DLSGECIHGGARGDRVRTPRQVCPPDPDLATIPVWSWIRQPPLADELAQAIGAVPRLAACFADRKLSQPPLAKGLLKFARDLVAGDRCLCGTVVLEESSPLAQPGDERRDEAFHSRALWG